jgi:hypothetical protein
MMEVSKVTLVRLGNGAAIKGGEDGNVAVRRIRDIDKPLVVHYRVTGDGQKNVDEKLLHNEITLPRGVAEIKIKIKAIGELPDGVEKHVKITLLPGKDKSYVLGNDKTVEIKISGKD